ncbi:methylated-DNA--[protein]-cysteine S-methyltransferase [Frigidibacter sp. ROC022]|uniref:methylated-DNA--[protein]-cysteine S-methyltransferase n=1 Tax=Frigidibacter sp. ROC022 TaxID=2971796 RepID=UPI00215A815A|nr:methylated-DNA--[protein]-cysteine S-methyltransferase [Frigidibacter sp. ROC022]MCR8725118.1 methylated-DNA--[protein]-cysteine S-methyltransferase [Frigidibacter sp. ROC022]
MAALSTQTPFGPITLIEEDGALVETFWRDGARDETPLLVEAARQLQAYFAHRLTSFDLPLSPRASPAQRRFCTELCGIPFGETRTYGEMARKLGLSAQAAGKLCGGNPIPIIVPCHRVTGTGNLGGFSAPGGIETKVALLKHEGAASLLI